MCLVLRRYEVVMAIVTTAKRDFSIVAESEDLLEFVKERTLDKKVRLRLQIISSNIFLCGIFTSHFCTTNSHRLLFSFIKACIVLNRPALLVNVSTVLCSSKSGKRLCAASR